MRLLLVCLSLTLFGCSFGGFKPPRPYYSWSLHNEDKLFPNSDPQVLHKYLARRKKDMKACGMDFVVGDSNDPRSHLCMESKGWYVEGGPVCENVTMWDSDVCIKWRAKNSKPNAKPWSKNSK
ncbi:hypothetical protein A4G19_03010 [Pasteurellaceae bacterium Macca]|nr:hypothetical protein [Pasteurellaceae bacterium Macca]